MIPEGNIMKSEETYRLEEIITLATWEPGVVGCAEVGLGDDGIVDYVTMEIGKERTIRCYELKITRSDFLSDAKKTFIGDFNFYVIPTELWGQVMNRIEPGIGCWCVDPDGTVRKMKRATRKKCTVNRGYVLTRILLALEREHLKYVERDWQERQLSRNVTDYSGAGIAVGARVMWRGKPWTVASIIRKRVDTVLTPICSLEPLGWRGQPEEAKPAALKLVQDG